MARKTRAMSQYKFGTPVRDPRIKPEEGTAWDGTYEADPAVWPCPDGQYCRLGCRMLPTWAPSTGRAFA